MSLPTQLRPRRSTITPFLLVVSAIVLVTGIYSLCLTDFFLSDDFDFLWSCSRPGGVFVNHGWIGGTSEPVTSFFRLQAVVSLSGWLIYQLSDLNPVGWHLTNLALHLLNSLLVVILVRRFVQSSWASLAAGVLFTVHFIHAEPVAWISGRTSLLVTLFVLCTILVESSPRTSLWGWRRWLALVLAVLAFFTKEDSIVLMPLLLLVPCQPVTVSQMMTIGTEPQRVTLHALLRRIRHLWPYLILTIVYFASRIGAITTAMNAEAYRAYRLEAGVNVAKNILFVMTANLFPANFRKLLSVWNGWYQTHESSVVFDFVLSHLGIFTALTVALLFWIAMLLWGNRVARRFAWWMFIAAVPILFFRGTGERLLYLGSVGSSAAIAVLLAGWHQSFTDVLGRWGRVAMPAAFCVLILFHVVWLRSSLENWHDAATLSRTIVTAATELGRTLPPDAQIRFVDLPDNVGGAWVFRTSMDDAFRVYAGRPDVAVVTDTIPPTDTALKPVFTFRWNGSAFAPASSDTTGL